VKLRLRATPQTFHRAASRCTASDHPARPPESARLPLLFFSSFFLSAPADFGVTCQKKNVQSHLLNHLLKPIFIVLSHKDTTAGIAYKEPVHATCHSTPSEGRSVCEQPQLEGGVKSRPSYRGGGHDKYGDVGPSDVQFC